MSSEQSPLRKRLEQVRSSALDFRRVDYGEGSAGTSTDDTASARAEDRDVDGPDDESGDELIGGHTRWGRTVLVAGAPLVGVLALAGALITGLMAATFSLGNVPICIAADRLDAGATGLFGNAREDGGGDPVQVVSGGIETATIFGLSLAVEVPTPIGGGFTILLSAPSDVAVEGTNLRLDLKELKGGLEAHNFELGRDAAQLDKGNVSGPARSAGIQADSLAVTNAEINARSLSAGTIKLDQIGISVAGRDEGC